MADITTERNGRKTIQFKAPNGKRPKIRLGKIDPRVAEEVKGHVQHLADCWEWKKPPCQATDLWIAELLGDPVKRWLYDRLAAAGLVTPRDKADSPRPKSKKADQKPMPEKLGAFLDALILSRSDVKGGTSTNYKQVRRNLVEFFGEDKPLAEVSPGDADEFRRWLRTTEKLAENTTRRRCGRAKEFFRAAVRKRLIVENPFGDMKHLNVKGNKDREFFVTREITQSVLNVMVHGDGRPLVQWQLIFALNRFGAMRCPSETSEAVWEDVDWEHNKVTVHSPKTEQYDGKESRIMPLFPELRPYLEAAFNEAESRLGRPPSGTDPIIDARYRGGEKNLRTQLLRFLKRAGVKAWPKLFQNLRASRATELTKAYPAYMAAAWCGHSEDVAKEHYWQITEADFQRAASEATGDPLPPPHENAGQKAGQKCPPNTPKTQSGSSDETRNTLKTNNLQLPKVTPTGLEPVLPP